MTRRALGAALGLIVTLTGPASPQQWHADLYGGGTRYAAIGAQAASTATALVGNIRFDATRFSAFASVAAPLGEDSPAWTALGTSLEPAFRFTGFELGAALAADGFAWRQPDDRSGVGATTRLQPFVAFDVGRVRLQLHAARSDYVVSESSASLERHLYEGGGRITTTIQGTMIEAEGGSLHGEGGSWPFARVQLARGFGGVEAWAGAGRWFADDLDDVTWNAGASVSIARGYLWGAVQHTAAEPLYLSPERTSWNLGFTLPLGGGAARSDVVGPVVQEGAVLVRLERKGRAARGPIAVAGEFSEWAPVMMRDAGDVWELSIPATSGVLRFSFVDAAGEWFVPEGYPGRIADDMGGWVVLVVVP